MLYLIDGDIIVYKAAFACERREYFINQDGEKEKVYIIEPSENACSNANHLLNSILKGEKNYKIFLTASNDPTNFRKKLYPEYKANRKNMKKPEHYGVVREYLYKYWKSEVVRGQEADDALGIMQMDNILYNSSPEEGTSYDRLEHITFPTIICSIDKDLDMIPGNHYNISTGMKYFIDGLSALKCFYKQLLTGDSIDNIPGIKGIGKVRANNYLKDCQTEDEMKKVVLDLYLERGYTKEEMELNGKLLWIRRKPNEIWEFNHD